MSSFQSGFKKFQKVMEDDIEHLTGFIEEASKELAAMEKGSDDFTHQKANVAFSLFCMDSAVNEMAKDIDEFKNSFNKEGENDKQ